MEAPVDVPAGKLRDRERSLLFSPIILIFFPKLSLRSLPTANGRSQPGIPGNSSSPSQLPEVESRFLAARNNCSVNDPWLGPHLRGRGALPHVWSSHFPTSASNPIPEPAARAPGAAYLGKGAGELELPSEFPPCLFPLVPNSSFIPNPSRSGLVSASVPPFCSFGLSWRWRN